MDVLGSRRAGDDVFLLNYATVLRAQVKAQNAADAMAMVVLNTQALRWNKLSMALYAADIEEWRIRSLMQAMIDAANGNGGCSYAGGTCMKIYQALQPQLYKAVNRYTNDLKAVDSFSWYAQGNVNGSSYSWGLYAFYNTEIPGDSNACSDLNSSFCNFAFQLIDFSQRPATAQVGKDAAYVHVGGSYGGSFAAVTPDTLWQPLRTEISSCETVNPLVSFSLFGQSVGPTQVIGRAAATMVPMASEWLAPGVTTNPATGTVFQPTENYSSYDTFDAVASPRDWYETSFPAQPYTAVPATPDFTMTGAMLTPVFETYTSWWGVVPIPPYTTASQNTANLCRGYY